MSHSFKLPEKKQMAETLEYSSSTEKEKSGQAPVFQNEITDNSWHFDVVLNM